MPACTGSGGGWAWRIGTAKCEEHFLKRALAHCFVYLTIPLQKPSPYTTPPGWGVAFGYRPLHIAQAVCRAFACSCPKRLERLEAHVFADWAVDWLFEFRAYEGNNFSKYQFSVDWVLIGLVAINSSLPVEFYRQEDFGNGRQTLGDVQSLKTKNPLGIWDRCNQFNQFYR